MSRLNACDKHQIIAALELLFNQEPNGSELAKKFENKLPKPSLDGIFKRHNVLINAIGKAQPYTRYGSSRDDYCYKRCRSAVNIAKNAIIEDGKNLMMSKEWDTCLEYLVVTIKNIDRFPIWDSNANNKATGDLKKNLKKWYDKVKKGLGSENLNEVQRQRLQQLDEYLN